MSHHHTDTDPNHAAADGALEQFVRNRYFNGKLLTKRDMQAEQEYHTGRLETLARHVLGEGVVCGLETGVTADADGGVTVSIEPGLAIDHVGRPVVVAEPDEVSFSASDLSSDQDGTPDGEFSLFIAFEGVETEEVPTPGTHDASREDCEHNRVVESYTLAVAPSRPEDRKPIPSVAFPTHAELSQPNTHGDAEEPHQALSEAARSYYGSTDAEEFHYEGCAAGGDPHVFLGYYVQTSDGWERRPVDEPRHHVYSNDMLYAGIVGHAADFENPHEVHLAVEQAGDDTLLRNERGVDTDGSPPYPGDVAFSSADDVLDITGSTSGETGEISFDLGPIVEVGGNGDGLTAPFGLEAGSGVSLSTANNTVTVSASGDGGDSGEDNTADGEHATVPGGEGNAAEGDWSTVGGGDNNEASGNEATVGGGTNNVASGDESTVSGGLENEAGETGATVGGGTNNQSVGEQSVVGGGVENTASGNFATVPGGGKNTASGAMSFAAGVDATAEADRSFVWSSVEGNQFSSTAPEQFLVDAPGGAGVGTSRPRSQLHVQGRRAMDTFSPDEFGEANVEAVLAGHVASVENTSAGEERAPGVLALALPKIESPKPTHSYITFVDTTGPIGSIHGNGDGGIQFTSASADFAEYFPKAEPTHTFEQAQVVGLRAGEVVASVDDADTVLVVSTASVVAGNRPADAERDAYVKLALVGQVPVRVSGSVDAGDVLVPSPADDGTAVARTAGADGGPVLGQALGSHDGDGVDEVVALISGPDFAATSAEPDASGESRTARRDRTERLEAENDRLRADLAAKDERIEGLEARLSALEAHVGVDVADTPADD